MAYKRYELEKIIKKIRSFCRSRLICTFFFHLFLLEFCSSSLFYLKIQSIYIFNNELLNFVVAFKLIYKRVLLRNNPTEIPFSLAKSKRSASFKKKDLGKRRCEYTKPIFYFYHIYNCFKSFK